MILTTLLGRTVKERGMKTLSHEQLGFVMASFSKMRMVGMYILFSIVGLYLVLGYLKWLEYLTEMGINPTVVYFVLIMLYIITSQGLSIAKLRKWTYPPSICVRFMLVQVFSCSEFVHYWSEWSITWGNKWLRRHHRLRYGWHKQMVWCKITWWGYIA